MAGRTMRKEAAYSALAVLLAGAIATVVIKGDGAWMLDRILPNPVSRR